VGNSVSVGASLSFQIPFTDIGAGGGVKKSWDWSTSHGSGYSVTVGSSTDFGGVIPAIRDNPDTPEDEFKVWRYSFKPYVYRHHYKDNTGTTSGFFVITYAANPQKPPQ
jgi:hypothetical protein